MKFKYLYFLRNSIKLLLKYSGDSRLCRRLYLRKYLYIFLKTLSVHLWKGCHLVLNVFTQTSTNMAERSQRLPRIEDFFCSTLLIPVTNQVIVNIKWLILIGCDVRTLYTHVTYRQITLGAFRRKPPARPQLCHIFFRKPSKVNKSV